MKNIEITIEAQVENNKVKFNTYFKPGSELIFDKLDLKGKKKMRSTAPKEIRNFLDMKIPSLEGQRNPREPYETKDHKIARLENENKILKEENKILKEENKILKEENKILKEKVVVLENENKILKQKIVVLENENKTLKGQVEMLLSRIESLENKLSQQN